MTLRPMTLPALVCAALAAPPAPAQDGATSAPAVLQRASLAIENAQTGRATIAMDVLPQGSDFGAKLAQAMPKGTATFTWRRNDTETEDDTSAWRVVGEGTARKDQDPRELDILFTPDGATYLEHDRKRAVRVAPGRSDQTTTITDNLVLQELLDERPLVDAFAGADLALAGTETHDGELCDVLVVTMPTPESDTDDKPEYISQKWMIARSDAFPRRIERTADFSMFGTLLVAQDITDVELGVDLGEGELALDVPEGYSGGANTGRTTRPRPTRLEPAGTADATPRDSAPVTEHPAAPPFEIADIDGTVYSSESQRGRVTVLYYWGTWCVPCRMFSPLISDLAGTFADDDVDVLGLAIRERSPDAPKKMMADKGYAHTLVLGAEDTVRPFSVRVYPTIIVIGPDLTVREVGVPSRESTPEAVMGEVEAAVRDALAEG